MKKKSVGIIICFAAILTFSSMASGAEEKRTPNESVISETADTSNAPTGTSHLDKDKLKRYEEFLKNRNEMKEMNIGDSEIVYQDEDTTLIMEVTPSED
jgi:hypothetical protein